MNYFLVTFDIKSGNDYYQKIHKDVITELKNNCGHSLYDALDTRLTTTWLIKTPELFDDLYYRVHAALQRRGKLLIATIIRESESTENQADAWLQKLP